MALSSHPVVSVPKTLRLVVDEEFMLFLAEYGGEGTPLQERLRKRLDIDGPFEMDVACLGVSEPSARVDGDPYTTMGCWDVTFDLVLDNEPWVINRSYCLDVEPTGRTREVDAREWPEYDPTCCATPIPRKDAIGLDDRLFGARHVG